MFRRIATILLGIGLAVGMFAPRASAEEPTLSTIGTSFSKDCRGQAAPRVATYARPSYSAKEIGYEVGGGCALLGHTPTPAQGTWGWDYGGCIGWKIVALNRSNHGRYQGGAGAYRTDGLNLLH
jgi:hypothetical protein